MEVKGTCKSEKFSATNSSMCALQKNVHEIKLPVLDMMLNHACPWSPFCLSWIPACQRGMASDMACAHTFEKKQKQCRYYRYDRSGRDVCEGDSIEDLRKAISDMSDTVGSMKFFRRAYAFLCVIREKSYAFVMDERKPATLPYKKIQTRLRVQPLWLVRMWRRHAYSERKKCK